MGVTEGAVSQWMKRATEEGGVEALKKRTSPGAPPRLSENQRMQLKELLARGAPSAHGFRAEVWTCARIAKVIRIKSLVSATTRRTSVGWSGNWGSELTETDAPYANQRDEEAIKHWKEEALEGGSTGPSLKKSIEGRQDDFCLWISRAFTCYRPWCAPMLPSARLLYCKRNSLAIICR